MEESKIQEVLLSDKDLDSMFNSIDKSAITESKENIDIFLDTVVFDSIIRPEFIGKYSALLGKLDININDLLQVVINTILKRTAIPRRPAPLTLLYHYSLIAGLPDLEPVISEITMKTHFETALLCLTQWFYIEGIAYEKPDLVEIINDSNQFNTLHPTVQNFLYNVLNFSDELYNKIRTDSPELKTLDAILRRDDVELLSKVTSKEGFNPNQKTNPNVFERAYIANNGCTIASYCAYYKANKCLKALIEKGADLSIKDDGGVSIAQMAAAGGNIEGLNILKENNCDMEGIYQYAAEFHQSAVFESGFSEKNKDLIFLHRAAAGRNTRLVKELLEKGYNPNAVDTKKRTPLMYACMFGGSLSSVLAPITDCKLQDEDGMTALSFAAVNGYYDSAVSVIDMSDLEAKQKFGMTALHWACQRGHPSIVKLLIEKGADVNSRDSENFTPLHWAASVGCDSAIEILVTNEKTDLNAKQKDGMTALHLAASRGNASSISILLQTDIDANAVDDHGMTPILWAAQNGQVGALAEFIQDYSVDVNATDGEGLGVLHFLAMSEAPGVSEISDALVCSERIDPDSTEANGMTPLMMAVANGNAEMVHSLIQANANPNIKMNDGMAPLHFATREGNIDILKLLLACPATNVNLVNGANATALHLAAANGALDCVKALLSHPKIIKDPKDSDGDTPLSIARSFGLSDVVELLE